MKMTPFKRIGLDVFQDENGCVQGRYPRKYAPELVSGLSRDKAEFAYTEMLGDT